ncbi:ABC transporter ATP-binding protein [Pedobacter jeongneungensis]|uniref:ABC transporter ATP-binding protein n=1 Tax=Pedobacter jeongneungensis TaxID=947309 RepID=UPI00046A7CD4|nr:ABC transporter ATP-binding protein [Pedobacter jeongneungensis]
MSNAIKVENLSKAYQLGQIGTGTVSRDLERWFARIRGKEDPFLKIGETNTQNSKSTRDIVWSLRDINFEIEQGKAVGVIGRNGAGKSTLLKILSKITAPTTGKISGQGRIASLLEVGTGFHPELSGRENIFLNGAILGMRKKEITRKLDEIVDFAGIERYLDTPVKRYSSGMYVRLAFAVAAHLESEILIVDEVLAVGDAEFQKKCLGKMGEVSKGEGRTVLFVSHNMSMINQLCSSSIYLKNGMLELYSSTKKAIDSYLAESTATAHKNLEIVFNENESNESVQLNVFKMEAHFENSSDFLSSKDVNVQFGFKIFEKVLGLRIGFEIVSPSTDLCVFRTFHDDDYEEMLAFEPGEYVLSAQIPKDLLNIGEYFIYPTIGIHNIKWLSFKTHQLHLNIINIGGVNNLYSDERPGVLAPKINWNINHGKI